MNTGEAIKRLTAVQLKSAKDGLENAKKYGSVEIIQRNAELVDLFEMAISALRAQQERDKGCEHCKERKPLLDEIGQVLVDNSDSSLWLLIQAAPDDIYEEHTTIHFCHMCGRKLEPKEAR